VVNACVHRLTPRNNNSALNFFPRAVAMAMAIVLGPRRDLSSLMLLCPSARSSNIICCRACAVKNYQNFMWNRLVLAKEGKSLIG